MSGLKIVNVVGCRPNFVKIAPLMDQMRKYSDIHPVLVHTGQHYDRSMSDVFFRDLELPRPDIFLHVGEGSHAKQTAAIMEPFEGVLLEEVPDLVLVVGDVNSTLAAALTAVKSGCPVAHVEAGLRSFDREMPEETNRILTDAIADLLFATERSGVKNLLREGIPGDKIFFVGNVMIDTLVMNAAKISHSPILERLRLKPKGYALLTLHRPANVDERGRLERILEALETLQRTIPIVFPAHPRTMSRVRQWGLENHLWSMPNVQVTDPLGYIDFIKLVRESRLLLTDSGGTQEECTYLGIPCLTLRESTERPATVEQGTNRLVGCEPGRIVEEAMKIFRGESRAGRIPRKWDGRASERIVRILLNQQKHISQLYRSVRDRRVWTSTPTPAA